MTNKKAKPKKKKAKKKAVRKRPPPLTNGMVKSWGFECDDMVAAALKYKGNFLDRLKRSKALRDAWDRGRFLRDISQFASVAMTKAEVALKLEISLGAFETLLSDPEAADIWTRAQINALVQLKTGLLASAMAGKPAALKSFERILQEERPAGELNIYSLSIEQMAIVAGVTRQTLDKWVTEGTLTRKGDKTFDLRVFIEWFEGFCQRKVKVTPQLNSLDEMKNIKTLALRREYDLELGKLLPRDEVIAGYVGRLQQFLMLWDRLADGVADKCVNLPKQGVDEILAKFKDELRGEFVKVEIEMKLTDEQLAELVKFLEKLE